MLELNEDWFHLLYEEFERPYFRDLMSFLEAEIDIRKKRIYPKMDEIFRELNKTAFEDVKVVIVKQEVNPEDLNSWNRKGVVLINSVLTVEEKKTNSHKDQGWEIFTDEILELLNYQKSGLVFLLSDEESKEKGNFIDRSKHLVLDSQDSFFEKCNEYLKEPI